MSFAAVIGDFHVCPMVTGTVPHVGGPITGPCISTVLIGGKPAAVVGDCLQCTGPPDSIAMGSTTVMIGGMPAARVGDTCSHGGTIVGPGVPTVVIG
ncbi:PAAR domain-containing protein [Reichenbachiella versicolor]|uniref:PAAR domain-containing protein n=1 Tax=Reichenbachiella versicolor TaxID=1821036 RepID=UPI000D6E069E|nr:PAAR domain-containing protein [Reichenbachiella versicolor]